MDPREVYPELVWDVLWLEPIHYVMSAPPAPSHIQSIMDRPGIEDDFKARCGSGIGALYWSMKGAPGEYRTIQAACEICNIIYGDNFNPSVVTTVRPREHRGLMDLFGEKVDKSYKQTVEFAPEFGPE